MSTNYTCGECRHYALNKCLKTAEKCSEINLACKRFQLADDTDVDRVLPDVPEAPTKVCKVCGRELPLDSFQLNWKSADGHLNTCTDCMAEKKREGMRKGKDSKTYPYTADHVELKAENSEMEELQAKYAQLEKDYEALRLEQAKLLEVNAELKDYNTRLFDENLELALNADRSIDELIKLLRDKGCKGSIERPIMTYVKIEL